MKLLDQGAIKEGPNETKVLSNLKDMDADMDGMLTFEEMKAYFAAVGASLNDDEFKLIVGEMFNTVEASQLAAQLAAPLDPSSGAQVIEGCMKKLKDLNKPFKYIGAPAYLRER